MSPDWLRRLGYESLTEPQINAVLRAAYDALAMKVGNTVTRGMTDQELEQFWQLCDLPSEVSDPKARQWLITHRPNYPDVVDFFVRGLEDQLRKIARDFKAGKAAGSDGLSSASETNQPLNILQRVYQLSVSEEKDSHAVREN